MGSQSTKFKSNSVAAQSTQKTSNASLGGSQQPKAIIQKHFVGKPYNHQNMSVSNHSIQQAILMETPGKHSNLKQIAKQTNSANMRKNYQSIVLVGNEKEQQPSVYMTEKRKIQSSSGSRDALKIVKRTDN